MNAALVQVMNPVGPRRRTGTAQPALQAILCVTTAQWAQALRAEGAVARAAAIESPATRVGAEWHGRPAAPSFGPSFGKPRP